MRKGIDFRRRCDTRLVMTKAIRSMSLVVVSIVLLAGCGAATLSKASVEAGAMSALSAKVGSASPRITCPGDMPATVGATQTCTVPLTQAQGGSAGAGTYNVVVVVTAVADSTATFSVAVATMPNP